MLKSTTSKVSVRISLNASMKEAMSFLQKTRYPFMKEDEIFKLAFSRLYATEQDIFTNHSVGHSVLESIRKKKPEFALDWLKANGVDSKSVTLQQLISIIDELL